MIQGRLERVNGEDLVGWLWDDKRPTARIRFDVVVDGRPVAAFVADRRRGDLARKDIGDGAHSFRVRLLPEWFSEDENFVAIVAQPDGLAVDRPLIVNRSEVFAATEPAVSRAVVWEDEARSIRAVGPKAATAAVRKPPLPKDLADERVTVEALRIALDAQTEAGGDATKALVRTVEGLFKRRLWIEVAAVGAIALDDIWSHPRLLALHGRALLYAGKADDAVPVLSRLQELAPEDHSNIFYLGTALGRQGRWRDAIAVYERCIASDENQAKYFAEAGRASIQVGYGAYGLFREDRSALERGQHRLERALQLDDRDWRWHRDLAAVLLALGHDERALETAQAAVARSPDAAGPYTELAKVCVRLNRLPEALEAAERAVELDPDNDSVKFNIRFVRRLADAVRPAGAGEIAALTVSEGTSWREALESADAEWVAFDTVDDAAGLVERLGFAWAAGIRERPGTKPVVWRRAFLLAVLATDVLPPTASLERLVEVASAHGQLVVAAPDRDEELRHGFGDRRTVLLFSQYGIRKFGGGEHFLQQMAHLYRGMGFEVLVVGTQEEHVGEYGERDGLRYVYIDRSPEEILRLALDEGAAIVHVISGLVFEATTALRHVDVRVVHGVHSWRDMYVPPTPSTGYFPDIDRVAEPRPDFALAIQDGGAIYANADYTRERIEAAYGVRAPIIYSLPDEVEEPVVTEPPAESREDVMLLVNSRSDKGFDLVLDVAGRLPHRRFRAISSQSSKGTAEAAVRDRGLSNVEILDRVDDLGQLYARARIVAVPSYRFIETFSRVVIEAQRYGTPVIGSDRGNVPYLLRQSGVALPEDPDVWAEEAERLFSDDGEWQRRSALALENSERYTFRKQEARLSRLVSGIAAPMLVGVGSGLGNIIHTHPLIRNLARRLGRRLDVVVAGDHADLLFVPSSSEYVNHVFAVNDIVMNRRYDTVFLTHSFGGLVPKLSSSNIVLSRTWDGFNANHPLHEAEFNLAAARELLGIPYDPEDVTGYFLGDLEYRRPDQPLVGLHAGSKGGIWGSKRWPHYQELARRLQRDGYPVASFGIAPEYVDGTIDLTGGTVEEMSVRMLACTHFVSNDSGVMNVANALGIPLTAVFAPTNPRTRGPLGPDSHSISVERVCAPCEVKDGYRQAKFLSGACSCIDDIGVDVVHAAVVKALQQAAASPGAAPVT